MWVVHLRADPRVEVRVAEAADSSLAVDVGGLGSADDAAGHDDADIANARDVGVHEAAGGFFSSEGRAEGFRRGVDHAVRDTHGFGEDRSESDAREDVHVVALTGVVVFGLAGLVGVGEGLEGGARGE